MTQLILPDADYEQSYCQYIAELGEEERYPFVMDFPHLPFNALVERLNNLARGIDVPQGAVANHTFWLVNQNMLIGVANLRPFLTPSIANIGGHIGLGIRPSMRGKGWSKQLLLATLAKAAEYDLDTVTIHTHSDNKQANAMILSCGCEFDSAVTDDAGNEVLRYVWTSVKP